MRRLVASVCLVTAERPSGGTEPALLDGTDKRSCWDSTKEHSSDPARHERTAKYRSHLHPAGERATGPKRKGSCSPLPAGSDGGRSCAELTQSPPSKPRSQRGILTHGTSPSPSPAELWRGTERPARTGSHGSVDSLSILARGWNKEPRCCDGCKPAASLRRRLSG